MRLYEIADAYRSLQEMLDTPGAPIGPAVCMGVAAISTMGAGSALANLYERGRI